MKTTQKVSGLILNFNRAIKASRLSFVSEYFPGIESILDGLYKEGLIAGYKVIKEAQLIEIFLKYDIKDESLITKAKFIWKPSLQPTVCLPTLLSDSKNTTNIGILRTAKFGFLTGRMALRNKTGGIYLAKFS